MDIVYNIWTSIQQSSKCFYSCESVNTFIWNAIIQMPIISLEN